MVNPPKPEAGVVYFSTTEPDKERDKKPPIDQYFDTKCEEEENKRIVAELQKWVGSKSLAIRRYFG